MRGDQSFYDLPRFMSERTQDTSVWESVRECRYIYASGWEAAYDSSKISNILSLRVCIWFLIIINT